MDYLLDIARTGLAAVLLHRLRSAVCVVGLLVVLVPWLVGLALSRGLATQAEASARFGADLYVAGRQFGRPVPVPLDVLPRVQRLDGVTGVVPRIVGEVMLGKEQVHAVLVGLPPEQFDSWGDCIRGEVPADDSGPHQLVIGTTLARRLNLQIGSILPPFYRNDKGERLSRVVGIFKPDAPLWQANLILTTFATAATVFDQSGLATDLLVSCRQGYQDSLTQSIEQELSWSGATGKTQFRVTAREDLLALLPRGLLHREGIFNLHFLLAFIVAVLVLLVTSGVGLTERRREIGILKATGWQTDEILLRGMVESLCLCLGGACSALLLAWVWLRIGNGYGVAGFFLAGVEPAPEFPIPFELAPIPALLAFVLSFVVVLTGTLYSSWRAAITPPREAMR